MTDREQELVEALVALEDAADDLAGVRTEEIYVAMLEAGATPMLEAMDRARRRAVDLVRDTEAFRPVAEKRMARLHAFIEGGEIS